MGLLGLNDDEAMLMAASLLSGKGNAMANMGGGLLGVHGYRQGETERSLNNIRLTQAKQGLADDTQARQILMGGGEAVPYGKGASAMPSPAAGGNAVPMPGVNPGQSGGKMATFNRYSAIADQFEKAGLIDKAKQYRDIAEKSRPEIKEVRTMTQNGQRVSVAIYKDGTSEVMPYNPDAEKLHFADTGNQILPMDPFTGQPVGNGQRKSVTPDAVLSSNTARRGQDMTDSRQRELNAITREGQNTQIYSDPNMGPSLVNKRNSTATPITMGGQPIPSENQNKKAAGARGVLDLLDQAEAQLQNATHSVGGRALDYGAMALGQSTTGAKATASLQAIEGSLLSQMPRMEGPQSNYDVQNYKQAAGQISNPLIPIEIRQAAIDTIRDIQKRYAANGLPNNYNSGTIRKYNPATGKIE